MKYYEVLVGDLKYHGIGGLTYQFDGDLADGQPVVVPLRAQKALGIVTGSVAKPEFETKVLELAPITASVPSQILKLVEWLQAYYPAPLGAIARLFVPATAAKPRKKSKESSVQNVEQIELPKLTAEQKKAVAAIGSNGSYLLRGITGSGKTRLYLELAQRTIRDGRSCIVLTPEIGLTPQLVRQFTEVFPGQVVILHSQLTAAQRRDAWFELLQAERPYIVIGPRSALFAPIHDVGLIIMDESHDQAYKHESAPTYRADRVAARLAQLHDAVFVTGSATPSIEEYYVAQAKGRPVVRLTKLAKAHDYGEVVKQVVDMRDRTQISRSHMFSTALIAELTKTLNGGEQSMLFLNRRGTANIVLCTNCGWQPNCPHCDLSLSYHGDIHKLRCHVDGYQAPFPTACPECGNTEILFKSIGTKAVAGEVARLLPQARISRFDTDVAKEERLEQQLEAVAAGDTDIIIGTQMIAKGLDLPRLSLVGVVSADTGLFVPDYTAGERTFQLLTQVAGRVGRGHRAGKLLVQTYDPDNLAIQSALHADYDGFYDRELAERRLFNFPPFVYMLQLTCGRATSAAAEQTAEKLADQLRREHRGISVEGPSPSFHPRLHGRYRWQLIIKAKNRGVLTEIVQALPSGWSADLDPINLL